MSILDDKLKDFKYYMSKVPHYLKDSYGFKEHYKIWHDLLVGEDIGQTNNMDNVLNAENVGKKYKYLGETTADFTQGHIYEVIEVPYYQVTYYTNGGEGSVPVDSNEYSNGSTVNVDFSITPTPVGQKEFLGWSTNSTALTPEYTLDGTTSFTITGDVNLYAIYREYYLVSYNVNGGTGNVPIDSNRYYNGDTVNVKFDTTPDYDGRKLFSGWSLSSSAEIPTYTSEGTTTLVISSNITFYAVYETYYQVTYDLNGGSGTAPVDSNKYFLGENAQVLFASITAPETDYIFVGWSTDSSATKASFIDNGVPEIPISEDITLYAIYGYIDTFANSSWQVVRAVLTQRKVSEAGWSIGDTKNINISSTTGLHSWYARLSDTKQDRYEYSNRSGSSQAALEIMYITFDMFAKINNSDTNIGGYADSALCEALNTTIYNGIEADAKEVISLVKIKSGIGGTTATTSSANCHVFILAECEIFPSGAYYSIGINESLKGQYEYYEQNTSSSEKRRQRYGYPQLGYQDWWTRSPAQNSNSQFVYVNANGGNGKADASAAKGRCIVVAI